MSQTHWTGSSGRALAVEVVDRLKRGRSLDDLHLGSSNHRQDLRGLPASPSPASAPQQVGRLTVQAAKGIVEITGRFLSGIDLSEAQLNGWRLNKTQIADCKFDRARCIEWVLWGSAVRDSSFDRADLRGAILGTFPEGGRIVWENVTFIGADLRDASAYGAVFRSCDFSRARFENTSFNQCDFTRCRFAGRVEEAVFDGRTIPGHASSHEMEAVDFTDASFVNVEFRGYSLAGALMPSNPDVFVIQRFPCVARKVLQKLEGDESLPGRVVRGVLANSLRSPVERADEAWVFNRRDWREWGGNETVTLAETAMKQAETECLQASTTAELR